MSSIYFGGVFGINGLIAWDKDGRFRESICNGKYGIV